MKVEVLTEGEVLMDVEGLFEVEDPTDVEGLMVAGDLLTVGVPKVGKVTPSQ